MAALAGEAPGRWESWWRALRPATLPASAAPVLVGAAVAIRAGADRPARAAAALGAALLLQIAANLVNDYADHERGADGAGRLGPPRAAAQGWLSTAALRRGALVALAGAAALGLPLVRAGGWPIALGGVLALVSAWAYTAGPALGYRGLGDVLVFAFFGLFAVCGTSRVVLGAVPAAALASALPVGLLATAILAVNNLRDRDGDAAAGKRTLAVRLGERGARRYTAALVVASYPCLAGVWLCGGGLAALLPLATWPLARRWLAALRAGRGSTLNPLLAATARLELAFAALLALGWVL